MADQPALKVVVQNRHKKEFDGQAAALTSWNHTGQFDILPFHANFISVIKNKLIIHQYKQKDVEITFNTGVLRIVENQVDVYLEPHEQLEQ